jgi:hypothetical protein
VSICSLFNEAVAVLGPYTMLTEDVLLKSFILKGDEKFYGRTLFWVLLLTLSNYLLAEAVAVRPIFAPGIKWAG